MPIETKPQIDALINVIVLLRPEWNRAGVFSVLKKAHEEGNPLLLRPFEDIVVACTRKAADPKTRGPAPLLMEGRHWDTNGSGPAPNVHPDTGYDTTVPVEPCPDHEGWSAHNCGGCAADILAGLRPPEYKGLPYDPHKHGRVS